MKKFTKKITYILSGLILLLTMISCTSADLYRMNYPDDPDMQRRMEKEYGDKPIWNINE